MENSLKVTYSKDYTKVIITFNLDDDIASVSTLGDVSDEQIDALVKAGGADVEGWFSEME